MLGAPLGSDVQLECTVEASPMPVSYWLKGGRVLPNSFASASNGNYEQPSLSRPEMLLDGPKYGITEDRHGFRTNMRLVVRSFSPADVGTYHCVSTNSLGRADGTMRLYGKLFCCSIHIFKVLDGVINFSFGLSTSSINCIVVLLCLHTTFPFLATHR
uniref:Ig-like domain-containing protein n=1 Tax=Anopheles culicifacies TaxID=139723 RepID=A0A182MKR1_9DIPT